MQKLGTGAMLLLIWWTALAQPVAGARESAETLLEAARTKHVVEGKLEAAMALYDRVIGMSGAKADTRARAMLGKAQVLEKLGRFEAYAMYQQVRQQFPQQKEVVSIATTRALSLAGRAAPRQTASEPHRLPTLDSLQLTDVSADGRFALGYVPAGQRLLLTLVDINSGESRTLAETVAAATAGRPLFMPGDREVAHPVGENRDGRIYVSIHLTSLTSGGPSRVVLAPTPRRLVLSDRSPDGSALLLAERAESFPVIGLAWLSLARGTVQSFATFEPWRQVVGPRLSPDGRRIAFSAVARQGENDRHIYTIDPEGRNERGVVRMAGLNNTPIWSDAGTHLYFSSDRSSDFALWAVPLNDDVPITDPVLITPNMGGPIAARSGNLYYRRQPNAALAGQHVHIAERATGRVVKSFQGEGVAWSPDGKSLAYLRNEFNAMAVMVRNLDTGEERTFPHADLGLAQLRWLPDGTAVLANTPRDAEFKPLRGSRVLVHASTGTYSKLMTMNTAQTERSGVADISPDRRTLYVPFRRTGNGHWEGVLAVDMSTQEERELVRFKTAYPGAREGIASPGIAISPDGSALALQVWADDRYDRARLLIVRTDGSGYRELYGPFPAEFTASIVRWLPDGRGLLFFTASTDGGWRLMRIAAEGGEPQFDGTDFASASASSLEPPLTKNSPLSLDVSPDGSRIVFGAHRRQAFEVWIVPDAASRLKVK